MVQGRVPVWHGLFFGCYLGIRCGKYGIWYRRCGIRYGRQSHQTKATMEKQTQDTIAYQVINNLTGGIQSVTNHPFSLEQIRDEVDGMRLELLKNPKIAAQLDFRLFYQPIRCLEIVKVKKQDCADAGITVGPESFVWRTKNKVPKLLTLPGRPMVSYLGAADWSENYRTVDVQRMGLLKYDRYRFPTSIWVDGHFYFCDLPDNTELLGLIAAFEKPSEVSRNYECCKEEEYPIPGELIGTIIRTLVSNYQQLGYFRNPQPNTQAFAAQGGAAK